MQKIVRSNGSDREVTICIKTTNRRLCSYDVIVPAFSYGNSCSYNAALTERVRRFNPRPGGGGGLFLAPPQVFSQYLVY